MIVTSAASRLVTLLTSMSIRHGENYSATQFESQRRKIASLLKKGVTPTLLTTVKDLQLLTIPLYSHADMFYLTNSKGTVVGCLGVYKDNKGWNRSDVVYIVPKYRASGLGTALYLTAIQTLGSLRSSLDIGTLAVSTWRSLSKHTKVTLWRVLDEGADTAKQVPYKWGSDGIPTVTVDGQQVSIEDVEEDFFFQAKD